MSLDEQTALNQFKPPLELLKQQRSHNLLIFTNSNVGHKNDFLNWFNDSYLRAVSESNNVLNIQNYEQHEVDITGGRYKPIPYHYLSIVELSLDGAEEVEELITKIRDLHQQEVSAQEPVTWLYYPVSEQVGGPTECKPSMLTLAFANAVPGAELEFREWYATRHIRHALNVTPLVAGQCFELTQYQNSGPMDAIYNTIAMYEMHGTPQEIIESFVTLEKGTLSFPTLDPSRFAEWVYRPLEVFAVRLEG